MTEATVTQAYEAIPGEIWEEVDKIAGRNGNTHLEWAQSVDRLRCALAEHIHRHRTAASQASDAGQVEDIARKAMRKAEVARTDVVRPVNGTAPYTVVLFHGQRIEFHDNEWTIEQHRDAGSSKAAAYAQSINDGLFALAKDAVVATLTAPPPSDAGETVTVAVDHPLTKGLRTSQKALDEITRQEQANIAGYLALRDFPIGSASPPTSGEVAVQKVETVTGDYMIDPGEPFWRIEINGYCADFDFEEAANNFAAAINGIRAPTSGEEMRLREFVSQVSRMTTNDEMDGDMSGDDAVSTLSAIIEQARAALTKGAD